MSGLTLESVRDILKDSYDWDHPIGMLDFAHALEQKTKYLTAPRDKFSRWVYREKDSFPMGYIAFKDIRENHDNQTDPKYHVYSPNILNKKYSYGDRRNSLQATHVTKGIKNATTYLRPLTIPQLVELTGRYCRNQAASQVDELRNGVRNKINDITEDLFNTYKVDKPSALQIELKHMVESGYEFLDKELGQQLQGLFSEFNTYKEARRNNTRDFLFVEAYESFGQNKFKCTPVELTTGKIASDDVKLSVLDEASLPESIKGKLAVLSMVDVEHFVEGVGYRATENIFYLRDAL